MVTNSGKNILFTVSGADHPGITNKLMSIVSKSEVPIIDMGQSVTYGLLSLSFVLNLQDNDKDDHVIKELLFLCHKLNLNLTYKILEENQITYHEHGEKFILNCVAKDVITSGFMKDVSLILASNNINIHRIDRVSPDDFCSVEILTTVPTNVDINKVKGSLIECSNDHRVDVAFLKDNIFRRAKRLIVFDMDSTLIQAEVIDEMAKVYGVGEEVSHVTEKAMNGEIDFNEALRERVSKLEGLELKKMEEILHDLPLTPGVEDFIKTIKSLGYKVAVISGGFSYFANALKEKLGLDYAFANELKIVDGKLTGEIEGTIVNAEQKAMLTKLIAQQEGINMEQVVAIGDGANDLPMLAAAGLGIAFHAKEVVKKKASQHMSHGPMTSILYFLGIPGPVEER